MRLNSTSDSPIRIIHSGIYILSGVVDIRINHGQLALKAGVFDDRTEITLTKANSRLTRLVILGHSGRITFQALRWLNDIHAGILQIDYDASVIIASIAPGPDVPKLRRAQAVAWDTSLGLDLVRDLIARKVAGQVSIYNKIASLNAYVTDRLAPLIEQLADASTFDEIRTIESQIASIYWTTWSGVPILFARKDNHRIPESWKMFGTRLSPLSGSPRKASSPANAILNYLYALLEAETRIACLTMGMDPGLGIFHADQPYRDSLAYDLMEPVRPEVDSWLLDLLAERRFSKGDFFETPSGQIMLTKHLAHELVQTLPLWARIVAPFVEETARRLLGRSVPARLTQRSRMRSPRPKGVKPLELRGIITRVLKGERPASSCLECGLQIETPKRFCSSECRERYSKEELYPSFTRAGPEALKRLRAENTDPAHGGEAAKKRGRANKARSNERKKWNSAHSPEELEKERTRFKKEILPVIAECSINQIANATGFCVRYASLIRSGKKIPHPVHYPRLMKLIQPMSSPNMQEPEK